MFVWSILILSHRIHLCFKTSCLSFFPLSKSRCPIRATCHVPRATLCHCHCCNVTIFGKYLLQKTLLHPNSICLIREDNYAFPNNLTHNTYGVYTFTHAHICTCVFYLLWSRQAPSHDPGQIKPMCLRSTFWLSVSGGISRIHCMILSVWETLDRGMPASDL